MVVALLPVRLDVELGEVDGAVVELYVADGLVYADLRIPAPPPDAGYASVHAC
jgi:hypothetical protein